MDNETYATNAICPKCGYQFSDAWEMETDETYENTCGKCESEVKITPSESVRYYKTILVEPLTPPTP